RPDASWLAPNVTFLICASCWFLLGDAMNTTAARHDVQRRHGNDLSIRKEVCQHGPCLLVVGVAERWHHQPAFADIKIHITRLEQAPVTITADRFWLSQFDDLEPCRLQSLSGFHHR